MEFMERQAARDAAADAKTAKNRAKRQKRKQGRNGGGGGDDTGPSGGEGGVGDPKRKLANGAAGLLSTAGHAEEGGDEEDVGPAILAPAAPAAPAVAEQKEIVIHDDD